MENCVFCKIIRGDIPCVKIYENDLLLSFRDISPEAPQHVLIIPKKHINNINELEVEDANLIAEVYLAAKDIAKTLGIDETGYRIIANCGEDGGQTVKHIHFHRLGGRQMKWPPG
jgi:histidine triad (HIT) family protein